MNSRPASGRTWPFCRRSAAERRNGRRDDGPRRPREAGAAAARREPAAEDRRRGVEPGDRPLPSRPLHGVDEPPRGRRAGPAGPRSRPGEKGWTPPGFGGSKASRRGSTCASRSAGRPGSTTTAGARRPRRWHRGPSTRTTSKTQVPPPYRHHPIPLRRLPGFYPVGRPRGRRPFLSFDVNYRSKLWSPEEARGFVEEMLPRRRHPVRGRREAEALWGRTTGLSCGSSQPRGRRRWCSSGERRGAWPS